MRIHALSLLIGALLLVQACASTNTYSAQPIAATVVDADTSEPIEGVNVVVKWMLEDKATGIGAGDFVLMETVTDQAGTFQFREWRSKAPPRERAAVTETVYRDYETTMDSASPALIFFKSGYRPLILSNEGYLSPSARDRHHTWERSSEWDGKVIKLQKSHEGLEAYATTVEGMMSGVGRGIECPWKKTPRMYASLIRERQRLDKLAVPNNVPSLATMQHYFDIQKCGSAEQFFREYLQ